MLLYYITDRKQLSDDPVAQRRLLLSRIEAAAKAGIDLIQLREKDLTARELEQLASEAVRLLRPAGTATRLLINGRADIAIACQADGVHLPANDISPADARALFFQAGILQPCIAVSCHTEKEVRLAESSGADLAVFGPIFEKQRASGFGLDPLREIAHRDAAAGHRMPVLALGGIDLKNAEACIRAGSDGIAAIRLFQQSDMADTVRKLRQIPFPPQPAGVPRHPYLP